MGFLNAITLFACATTLVMATEKRADSGLGEEFDLLRAEISQLKIEVAQVKHELGGTRSHIDVLSMVEVPYVI